MRSIKALLGGRETITIERTASVRDAARLMAERRIGALPVLDGDRLAGIFTERDVLTRIVAAGRDASATAVGDVMSTGLVIADVQESCDTALQRMRQAHVRHLIALDQQQGGRLAGIVSLRDVLAADLDDKEEELTLLNAYVHYIPVNLQVRT
jgi:CBS domain-containing protein